MSLSINALSVLHWVCLPEWLAVRICIFETHLLELAAPVQLIMAGMCLLPQILHVDSDQHLSELYKVAVALVLN